MREAELLRETSVLKEENKALREQLETLKQEFRQFKQDVHDGKIGVGLRSPKLPVKHTRDIATSPLDAVRFPSISMPAGSRPNVIPLRYEDMNMRINSQRGSSVPVVGSPHIRIEEDRPALDKGVQLLRRRSLRLTSEEDKGVSERSQSRRRRRRRRLASEEKKGARIFRPLRVIRSGLL